jgi:hypothetical protein
MEFLAVFLTMELLENTFVQKQDCVIPCSHLARPPARHPQGGGLSYAVRRAAFASARILPPPQRSDLRFPSPVGHGRGLTTRLGCAVPLPSSFTSFGCGSAKPLSALSLATGLAFTRFALSTAREPSPGITHARENGESRLSPDWQLIVIIQSG